MRVAVLLVLGASRGLHVPRLAARRPSSTRHATAVEPSLVESVEPFVERTPVESAVRSLADVTLSLLAGDEDAAEELFADKAARRQAVTIALDGFDLSRDGLL